MNESFHILNVGTGACVFITIVMSELDVADISVLFKLDKNASIFLAFILRVPYSVKLIPF